MNNHITGVPSEIDAITATAESGQGSAVLMLNLNHYTAAAGFPNGSECKTDMAELEESVGRVGGKVLRRTLCRANPSAANMMGSMRPCPSGTQASLVLGLRTEPGSAEMYRLRELCVANAVIHRCPGGRFPLQP